MTVKQEGTMYKELEPISVRRPSDFGAYYDESWVRTSAVIVMGQTRYGLEPIQILLPHQVYVDSVRAWLASGKYSEIWVQPVDTSKRRKLVPPAPLSDGHKSNG